LDFGSTTLDPASFQELYERIPGNAAKDAAQKATELTEQFRRVSIGSTQASEILYYMDFLVSASDVVLIGSKQLDTALGHEFLVKASWKNIPAYAVAVDNGLSPLAPAYLKATLYPSDSDELLRTIRNCVTPRV
jgi:hypothetical protein